MTEISLIYELKEQYRTFNEAPCWDIQKVCDLGNKVLSVCESMGSKYGNGLEISNRMGYDSESRKGLGEHWVQVPLIHYRITMSSGDDVLLKEALNEFLTKIDPKPCRGEGRRDLCEIVAEYGKIKEPQHQQ